MSYKVKVKKISVVNEAGDRVVIITCYLMDTAKTALQAVDGSITFDVRVPKSAPIPNPVPSTYLANLAKTQIAQKYNRYLTATTTPTHGSYNILFNSTDVAKLFTGLTVTGPGIFSTTYTGNTTLNSNIITSMSNTSGLSAGMIITGTTIPSGTTITLINSLTQITISQNATAAASTTNLTFPVILNSISAPTQIQLSVPLVLQLTGTTTAPYITLTGTTIPTVTLTGTVTTGSGVITMASTTGIAVGMNVTGAYIPSNTVVTSITTNISITINQTAIGSGSTSLSFAKDSTIISMASTTGIVVGMSVSGVYIPSGSIVTAINTNSSITINQKATGSGSVSLTFTTVTNSIYLTSSTSYFTSTIYEGLSIAGPSTVPRNTTISQVISPTQIQLSNNATDAATGTSTISGSFIYYFDTVNLVLDTSELTNISSLPIINFANL